MQPQQTPSSSSSTPKHANPVLQKEKVKKDDHQGKEKDDDESVDYEKIVEPILADIQELQKTEWLLAQKVQAATSDEDRKKWVDRMNQLTSMRVSLYRSMAGMLHTSSTSIESSMESWKDQRRAIAALEKQLNDSKTEMKSIQDAHVMQLRQVEIQQYFSEKYQDHTVLMQLVSFTFLVIALVAFLVSSRWLPSALGKLLLVIVSLYGGYYIIMKINTIWMRDNMNYQSFDWMFDPDKAPSAKHDSPFDTKDPWKTSPSSVFPTSSLCVGSACCSVGQVFDARANACVDVVMKTN